MERQNCRKLPGSHVSTCYNSTCCEQREPRYLKIRPQLQSLLCHARSLVGTSVGNAKWSSSLLRFGLRYRFRNWHWLCFCLPLVRTPVCHTKRKASFFDLWLWLCHGFPFMWTSICNTQWPTPLFILRNRCGLSLRLSGASVEKAKQGATFDMRLGSCGVESFDRKRCSQGKCREGSDKQSCETHRDWGLIVFDGLMCLRSWSASIKGQTKEEKCRGYI